MVRGLIYSALSMRCLPHPRRKRILESILRAVIMHICSPNYSYQRRSIGTRAGNLQSSTRHAVRWRGGFLTEGYKVLESYYQSAAPDEKHARVEAKTETFWKTGVSMELMFERKISRGHD